jgi:hypothetical protein
VKNKDIIVRLLKENYALQERVDNQYHSIAAMQATYTEQQDDLNQAYAESEVIRTKLREYMEHSTILTEDEKLVLLKHKLTVNQPFGPDVMDVKAEEPDLVEVLKASIAERKPELDTVTAYREHVKDNKSKRAHKRTGVTSWKQVVNRLLEEPAGTKVNVPSYASTEAVRMAVKKYQLQHEYKNNQLYVWYPADSAPASDESGV